MEINLILMIRPHIVNRFMSLGENSLVAAYQGRGQLKSRPSGTRVVTIIIVMNTVLYNKNCHYNYMYSFHYRRFLYPLSFDGNSGFTYIIHFKGEKLHSYISDSKLFLTAPWREKGNRCERFLRNVMNTLCQWEEIFEQTASK